MKWREDMAVKFIALIPRELLRQYEMQLISSNFMIFVKFN